MHAATRFFCLTLLLLIFLGHAAQAEEGESARPVPDFSAVLKDESVPDKEALADTIKDLRHRAPRGDAEAQEQLGEHYEDGNGVKQNYTKAAGWYERAAHQGYAKAQNKLGYLYLRGLGVPQNYGEAYFWITISANPLDKRTKSLREEIKKTFPPEKVSALQQRIAEWVPEEEDIDPLDAVDEPDESANEGEPEDEVLCKGYDVAGRTAPLPRRSQRPCRKAHSQMQAVCFNITSCADCEAALKNFIIACRKTTTAQEANPAYACDVDFDCHLIESNYCEVTYEPLAANRQHLQEVRRARAIPVIDCPRPPEVRAKYRAVCTDHMCQVKKTDE